MTDLLDEKDFSRLTAKIARERGFACASYKDRCLRRRIAVRMRARGVQTYGDYCILLDRDAAEYEQLLQALTINVTRFFRNPEVYESIAREVLPQLWALPDSSIRLWSAGCASGEEPYSLAIMLQRFAARMPDKRRLSRFRVIATDIDRPSLGAAKQGSYHQTAFADTPEEVRNGYFSPGWPATVRDDVKAMVEFHNCDLFGDRPPAAPYHLIICRNVIIYFDRPSQERLFAHFHSLLVPGGFLILGKVETILGESRTLFSPVDARERIFRRR
jgi:chemotaxis protein methyltransferase CheR